MSDPFSVTVGVVGLVVQSIKAVQTIQNYVSKYQIADLSIATTRTECSTIRIALLQIQDLFIQNKSTSQIELKNSFSAHAIREYEEVLSACSMAFSVLNGRLAKLNVASLNKNNESSFRSKLIALWNDDEMNVLRQNIRGLATAINLLLSAFQAGSSAKTCQLLKEKKNRSILKTVSDDARTLFTRSHRARTITQKNDLESSGSVIGDKVFEFDDSVINSAAYRRAYHSYTTRTRQTSNSKDEGGENKEGPGARTVANPDPTDLLVIRDEGYLESAYQRLCQRVQHWVRRFSKCSDFRLCRSTGQLRDDKVIDRLDSAILDGSDVDVYLADRIKRRHVFTSVIMTMIWEFIFTRYLFGLKREERQQLKALEKELEEVGSPPVLAQWRALTLTMLSRRAAYAEQRSRDSEAVAQEIFDTLHSLLPPPPHLAAEILGALGDVIRGAVDLSVDMRTQRAKYIMLPPLQPEYDENGELCRHTYFKASLMNERSDGSVSNKELEAQKAVVRLILFPLVIKKGDDSGFGNEEVVVFPAQVLVSTKVTMLAGNESQPSVVALSEISQMD